jgi:serine/threonine-protein kinase HipA
MRNNSVAERASLALWKDTEHIADITHDAQNDTWGLIYSSTWLNKSDSYSLCPSLPLLNPDQAATAAYPSGAVKRFLENLLPEGHALDMAAASQRVSKNNVFGLIRAMGSETAGAFRFLPPNVDGAPHQNYSIRQIALDELSARIASRDTRPLLEWEGKIRMSVAGYQDKLPVYLLEDPDKTPRLFLPDYPLASTHILKPEPQEIDHMVANEHYCMSLAKAMGLPVADVAILRVPQPILAVKRFDRRLTNAEIQFPTPGKTVPLVQRLHIIDACQAYDFPVSLKYERNFGSNRDVAHIRDGMSLPRLFKLARQHSVAPAASKRTLMQWALFQLLIGNFDAHGKNFSFFVSSAGLQPAPWYDLVSVAQYPRFTNELAMAVGDAFTLKDISGMELAQFAVSCNIQQSFLVRETIRLCQSAKKLARPVLDSMSYEKEETAFVQGIVDFVIRQADWLINIAQLAGDFPTDSLNPYDPDLDSPSSSAH